MFHRTYSYKYTVYIFLCICITFALVFFYLNLHIDLSLSIYISYSKEFLLLSVVYIPKLSDCVNVKTLYNNKIKIVILE